MLSRQAQTADEAREDPAYPRPAEPIPAGSMTGLYWTAAAMALLSGLDATVKLLRDWSLMVATSAACMLALSAALILTAANPALLQASPSPPAITWASSSLGLLAAWAFLRVLAAVTGKGSHAMMHAAIPVLGLVSAGLLEVALQHARAPHGAQSPPWLPAMAAQLVLLSYYCPALGGIAALAWRCARQIPVRHISMGMRAVAAAAVAELALILARSGIIIAAVSGASIPQAEISSLDVAQGTAVIQIIAGATTTAWFPPLALTCQQCRMWSAWWRLRPLWAILSRAVPEVRLPPQPGTRLSARYRLHRRVIEIRDGELMLRPYWDSRAASRAADAARSAGLPPDRRDAVIEAALIRAALDARMKGAPPGKGRQPGPAVPVPENTLGAETAQLLLVARAIRHPPGPAGRIGYPIHHFRGR